MAAICGRAGRRQRWAEAEAGSSEGLRDRRRAQTNMMCRIWILDVFSVKAEVGEELGVCVRLFGPLGAGAGSA